VIHMTSQIFELSVTDKRVRRKEIRYPDPKGKWSLWISGRRGASPIFRKYPPTAGCPTLGERCRLARESLCSPTGCSRPGTDVERVCRRDYWIADHICYRQGLENSLAHVERDRRQGKSHPNDRRVVGLVRTLESRGLTDRDQPQNTMTDSTEACVITEQDTQT
jgi:hypothetical protein